MEAAAGSLEMERAIEVNVAARHRGMGRVVNYKAPIGGLDNLDSVGKSQIFGG